MDAIAAEPRLLAELPPLPLSARFALWGGLGIIAAVAWAYLIQMPMTSGSMAMAGMEMPMNRPWNLVDLRFDFIMWMVMMVAMMTPSVAPMASMYARMTQHWRGGISPCVWLFVAGYLLAWTGFSAVAAFLQYLLERTALISDAMAISPLTGAVLMIVAGAYQLTSLKTECLSACRSTRSFFISRWTEQIGGIVTIGAYHGWCCIGCCWLLMAILFAAGIMNLEWVAALSALVIIEKATPWGRHSARISGFLLIMLGLWIVARRLS